MLKNITFSADASQIDEARKKAAAENTTLNEVFREWLAQYTARPQSASEYRKLMAQLSHVRAGRRFTREEMNERP